MDILNLFSPSSSLPSAELSQTLPMPFKSSALSAAASPSSLVRAVSAWSNMSNQLQQQWQRVREYHAQSSDDAAAYFSSDDCRRYICHRSLTYPLPVYMDSVGAAIYCASGAAASLDLSVSISLSFPVFSEFFGHQRSSSSLSSSLSSSSLTSSSTATSSLSLPASAVDEPAAQAFTVTVSRPDMTVLDLMKVHCDRG